MEFNQINLTTHDHVDRRIIYAVLGSVALLVALFTLFNTVSAFQVFSERSTYRSKIKDLQQQGKSLQAAEKGNADYDSETAAALQKRSRHVNRLIALDIFPWTGILDELEKAIPPQVVLNRFLPAPDFKTIRISGHTPSVEPITQFQDALGKSPLFQSVVLENMDFGQEGAASTASSAKGAMQFEMICGLNLKEIFPEDAYGGLWMTIASATAGSFR